MRPDYQNMKMAALVDLLAQETQRFTQFMTDKEYGTQYEQCKHAIQQIQVAIRSKQEDEGNRDNDIHPAEQAQLNGSHGSAM